METYTLLRQFADSWMLLFLFLFFVAVVFWIFRPGGHTAQQESAQIPFRHADKPASTSSTPQPPHPEVRS